MNKNDMIKYSAVGAAGIGLGFAAGWISANVKLRKEIDKAFTDLANKYEESVKNVTAEYQENFERFTKTGRYATVNEAAATLIDNLDDLTVINEVVSADDVKSEMLREDEEASDLLAKYRDEYGGLTFPSEYVPDDAGTVEEPLEDFPEDDIPITADDSDEEPEPTNPEFVFRRDPHGPYVISLDMFMDQYDDSPYTKMEMTYFEEDDTLIDSREHIVPNLEDIIGRKNLSKFGVGTTDEDQVYIRNERIEADIEVTRDERSYTRVVLGIIPDDEVKRSMTKPLKMRHGDHD